MAPLGSMLRPHEDPAVFSGEDDMTVPVRLSRRFDAVIFVHKTTRARPLAAGKRD